MKINRITVSETGGPEVLKYGEAEIAAPGPGEVQVRHTAIGLNFGDIYLRSGMWQRPLPFTPGSEAAGVVEAVGPGANFKVGDRVAYGSGPGGAYADACNVPAAQLIRLPSGVDDITAAAGLSKGLTAQYLLFSTYRVGPTDVVLAHAAAGGVGGILCQWGKHLGATVIGTVSSEEKAKVAKENGCDHVINYSSEDFVARVAEITNGAKATVVYDSIGEATFLKSLDCLRPLGMMVAYGQSSGTVSPFPIGLLAAKGSLYLTRPTLATHVATREGLERGAKAVFEAIEQGIIRISVSQRFALKDAVDAHRALADRKTSGSSVLTP
jgi:NADPH2:quinone reductase